jgi:acetyltransferase-like isoleucine patch superfamily enzyme
MKNPLSHIKPEAPFHLVRSLLFNFSPKVEKLSVSKSYLGLCAYINGLSSLDIERGSKISFDDSGFLVFGTERSSFRGWAGRSSMYIRRGGELHIYGYNQIGRGSLVWILEDGKVEMLGNSFTAGKNMIISKESVSIGKDCAIAWGVTICDHDFHKLYKDGIQKIETAPVKICDRVWLGMNSTVLKGVTVGEGAVVAGGSVVVNDVPPGVVVGGNPAKIICEGIEFLG